MKRQRRLSTGRLVIRLFGLAGPVKKELMTAALSSILGNLAHMGLMGFGAALLLSVYSREGSLCLWAVLTAVSGLLIPLCRYLEGIYSHGGSYRLLANLRVHLFDTLRALAPACLMERKKGDILNIAVADIECIEYFFAHAIGPMMTVILLPCLTLALAFYFDPLYPAVLLPVYLILCLVFPLVALKAGRRAGEGYRSRLGELKALVLEGIYGLRDIQIFGYEKPYLHKILLENDKVNRAAHGLALHKQTVSSAPTFFVYLARILILLAAYYLVSEGDPMQKETVILSFVAAASFSSTFSLTMVISSLLEAFAAARRLFEILDTSPAVTEPVSAQKTGPIQTIRFDRVTFSYEGQSQPVLRDFSLEIKKGEKIGLMGESGAGKSTILRLLMRFWEPEKGNITINGIDLKEVSFSELYRRIAVLEQETFLFDASIRENIAMGRPQADQAAIVKAAKGAGIHEMIRSLPQGYDTPVGQMSMRLSGGERQRVGIARILLMQPDVILMDEPTSNLDVFHEMELLQTLKEEYPHMTLMIISHRPSTLTGCDRILRLEKAQR